VGNEKRAALTAGAQRTKTKEEGRRKKEEGRRKEEEGRRKGEGMS